MRVDVFVFILACTPLVSTLTVYVPQCMQTGIQWVLNNGPVGGITYIEQTTNASCSYPITTTANETFDVIYATCGVSPVITNGNTVHKLFIVVQTNPLYNTDTDLRVLVECNFDTGTTSVGTAFVGPPKFASGNPGQNITISVNPKPQLALYTDVEGNETIVTQSTILVQGTPVTARITLDQNTADYNMKVDSGELAIGLVGSIQVKGSFQLLNGTTSCSLHEFFLSFMYMTTTEGYPYAETEFNVTIPTITDINLETTKPELRLSFRVTLCLKGSGCVQDACPDRPVVTRRRRQVEDGATSTGATNDSASYNLTGGFMVAMESGSDSLVDSTGGVVLTGSSQEGSVCLDRAEFWGLVMGLLGFLVLACLASCCLCFFIMRCRRRRRERRKTVYVTETIEPTASTISSGRALTGEPVNKGRFILPRFVAIPDYGNQK